MWGSNPSERSLPEWIKTAYEVLEAHLSEREGGLSPETAQTVILEATAEELDLTPADAEYAVQRLLDRGYLYAVDGEVFVTEPATESEEGDT